MVIGVCMALTHKDCIMNQSVNQYSFNGKYFQLTHVWTLLKCNFRALQLIHSTLLLNLVFCIRKVSQEHILGNAVMFHCREEQKVFFIANTRCENMVLDVEGQSRRPGASVIIYHRKKPCEGLLNQLWYADNRTSTIRTCLNDFCLDVIGKSHSRDFACIVVIECNRIFM